MKCIVKSLMLIMLGGATLATAHGQTLTVVHEGNNVYLEKGTNFGSSDAYRLGPSATQTLIEGLKRAIRWYDLNQNHRKSFTKEVCRFPVMDKSQYKFHGYVASFTNEMHMVFEGNSDGSMKCFLKIEDKSWISSFWTLRSKKDLQKLLNLMQGKSANPEIDDIFRY